MAGSPSARPDYTNDQPDALEGPGLIQRARAEAMLRCLHEHNRSDGPERTASLIHPDAVMNLLVSHGETLRGPTAVLAALSRGREAEVFLARVDRFEWLDRDTSLTFGQARYAIQKSGIAQGKVVWLDQFRDGLIWRVRFFKTEKAARDTYASERTDS